MVIDSIVLLVIALASFALIDAEQYGWAVATIAIAAAVYVTTGFFQKRD